MSSPPPVIERTQPGVCFVLIACYPLLLFLCFLFFFWNTESMSRLLEKKSANFSIFSEASSESLDSDLFLLPGCLKFTLRSN